MHPDNLSTNDRNSPQLRGKSPQFVSDFNNFGEGKKSNQNPQDAPKVMKVDTSKFKLNPNISLAKKPIFEKKHEEHVETSELKSRLKDFQADGSMVGKMVENLKTN